MNRRKILKTLSAALLFAGASKKNLFAKNGDELIKAAPLKKGDTVGVVAPGTAVSSPDDLQKAKAALDYFGLNMKLGKHVASGSGYKTRSVEEQLEDLHGAFADTEVAAVIAIRGGYGCSRLLDAVDYELIAKNPKIFVGYSDITALHLAVNKFSKLVTFHGPVLLSAFNDYTCEGFRRALFSAQPVGILRNSDSKSGIRDLDPVRTIVPGRASGALIGGNLSLVSALVGTPYEIDANGKILMLEDVGEPPYRIDRMLAQLKLAGILNDCEGVVFGECAGCDPDGSQYSVWDYELGEVLDYYFKPLNKPSFYGLTFGHTSSQLTFPIGVKAVMDSEKCEINVVEPALKKL